MSFNQVQGHQTKSLIIYHEIPTLFVLLFVSVGNIPYEATEDALREIFDQAGPVVSFR